MLSSVDYAVDALDRDLALEVLESGSDRANVPIRLLNLGSLVRTYVEVYDKANDNDRAILRSSAFGCQRKERERGNISSPCPATDLPGASAYQRKVTAATHPPGP